jgi:hypothetical protein
MNTSKLNHALLNATFLNGARELLASSGGGVKWETVTVSGVGSLELQDAITNSISSFLLYGGCKQASSPSPTSPKDISTNRGYLGIEFGKNLLEIRDDNIVVGKYINNAGVSADSLPNCYFQRFVAVKPNTTYTLSTSEALNYANFMEYDADGVFIKRTLYGSSTTPAGTPVSHTMGDTTAFVIIGSNVNSSKYPSISKDDVKGIKWMFNEGGTALKYEAFSMSVVDAYLATIFVSSTGSTQAGTERLLGVADYNDTQEVVSGAVVRRCGFAILDGSENISKSNNVYTIGISDKIKTKTTLLCTHFGYSTSTSSSVADKKIISFASQNVGFRYDACADAEAFRQWLQMQYAKQKPVIVVYPIATEIAESVAPQAIRNNGGDDYISLIQTNLSQTISLPIEVTYKKKVVTAGGESFTFTIDGQEYVAEEGMDWAAWCDSELNLDGYYINDSGNVERYENTGWFGQYYNVGFESKAVSGADAIKPNANYYLISGGIG